MLDKWNGKFARYKIYLWCLLQYDLLVYGYYSDLLNVYICSDELRVPYHTESYSVFRLDTFEIFEVGHTSKVVANIVKNQQALESTTQAMELFIFGWIHETAIFFYSLERWI